MHTLKDYEPIVGENVIEELRVIASALGDKKVQNINSTAVGGGVAEILHWLVPLLRDLGVNASWDVIKGGKDFFDVTKKFHNSLHGKSEILSAKDYRIFEETTQKNINEMDIYGDIVFVHDPQPAGLVKKKDEMQNKWVWRCHIDLSSPNPDVWNYLKGYIERYDASVFTAPQFSQELSIRQAQITPSIDPLSDKNKDLKDSFVSSVLEKYGISDEIPFITQVSRYDYLKDPLGVIDAYRIVKKRAKCQLVLVGSEAADDPEGAKVLKEVKKKAKGSRDIHILTNISDVEVNALQRASAVILQKSLKEGFGLTVSEALWKGRPVVASDVGGISLQIKHGFNGLLSHTIEGTAHMIRQLLYNPEYAKRLGDNGREHVRHNFLLTRHLKDYILLFLSLEKPGDFVYLQ